MGTYSANFDAHVREVLHRLANNATAVDAQVFSLTRTDSLPPEAAEIVKDAAASLARLRDDIHELQRIL